MLYQSHSGTYHFKTHVWYMFNILIRHYAKLVHRLYKIVCGNCISGLIFSRCQSYCLQCCLGCLQNIHLHSVDETIQDGDPVGMTRGEIFSGFKVFPYSCLAKAYLKIDGVTLVTSSHFLGSHCNRDRIENNFGFWFYISNRAAILLMLRGYSQGGCLTCWW